MSLTLEQIAKLAGVSRSTVSRVVNEHPSVRPEVRKRVWQVIRDNDYQPHQAARTLVTRRTNAIGIIIPETVSRVFSDPFFPQLVQGIADITNRCGYSLMLTLMTASTDRDTLYRRILNSGQLDGVIVASADVRDHIIPRLREIRNRCVLVGMHPDYTDLPWVDVDNVAGAQSMVEYLVSLGHRRIGHITGPLASAAGRERLEGYRRGLAAAGIGYDDALVAEGDFAEPSGASAMEHLLLASPTAVFATSDLMAVGAIKAVLQAGLRVPDDISIAGFDDAPIASVFDPPLTTVQQLPIELGKLAAERLIGLLDNPDLAFQPQVLPTRLIIRRSTRPL